MHSCSTKLWLLKTPIGKLNLQTCSNGVHVLEFFKAEDELKTRDSSRFIDVCADKCGRVDDAVAEQTVDWLKAYFRGSVEKLALPAICVLTGADNVGGFSRVVWKSLVENVTFGKTVSYGQLAHLAGNAKAARAAGHAMATNPVVLLIPCHRVIRSDGSIGHYGSGKYDNVKQTLLQHEQRGGVWP